jgi:CheY-like chemotaxis protein
MGGKNKVNILMLDDEPGKLLSDEVMLGDLGKNLIKAKLELLLNNNVAVVLTDVSMPRMNGFELARYYLAASSLSTDPDPLHLSRASDRRGPAKRLPGRSGGLNFSTDCSRIVAGQSLSFC